MSPITVTTHLDDEADAAAAVDRGLGDHNAAVAPLHEVRPLSCFARSEREGVVGGAVGRRWGACVELQQLWVAERFRRQGIGRQLVLTFEAAAAGCGCRHAYLDTFSFQSPAMYQRLGYELAHEQAGFPGGIVRYHFVKRLPAARTEPAAGA